jgi:hypothetical protein
MSSPEAPPLHLVPEKEPESEALEIIEDALRTAQEARKLGRSLKSDIPLPLIEEIAYGNEGIFGAQTAIHDNETFYEGLMKPDTIKRRNRGGILREHIVEGRHPEDDDVRIRYTTSRVNVKGNITDSSFSASVRVRVKKARRLPLARLFR